MRVIDLLNKIANREEVPKKFRYKGETYIYKTYTFEDGDIMTGYGFEDGGWLNIWRDNLNDEVEILEEDKKIPEKLGYFDLTKDKNEKDENGNNLELHYTGVADTFDDVYEKINEIIDYLDYLKSKGDE